MKRLIALSVSAAIALVPVTTASAAKTGTKLTMDAAFNVPGEAQFAGDIFSRKRACKDGRKVVVFRVRPGADQKIGATKSYKGMSDGNYYWVLSKEGYFAPAGTYYAKAPATKVCKAARSNDYELVGV